MMTKRLLSCLLAAALALSPSAAMAVEAEIKESANAQNSIVITHDEDDAVNQQTQGENAVVIGDGNTINDTTGMPGQLSNNVAVGNGNMISNASNSIAIGGGHVNGQPGQYTEGGIAIGFGAMSEMGGIAIGAGSHATGNEFAVGGRDDHSSRRIVGVADGQHELDAVNVRQMHNNIIGLRNEIISGSGDFNFVKYSDQTQSHIMLGSGMGTIIDGLMAGEVTDISRFAVNGSQLYGMAQSAGDLLFGMNTINTAYTIDQLGRIAYMNGFSLPNLGYNNIASVQEAFNHIDQSISDLQNNQGGGSGGSGWTLHHENSGQNLQIGDGGTLTIASGSNIEISTPNTGNKLTIAVSKTPTFDKVTINGVDGVGLDMSGSVIDDLGAGEISKDSTQAINGSQLWQLSNAVAGALGDNINITVDQDNNISYEGGFTVNGKDFDNIQDALDEAASAGGSGGGSSSWELTVNGEKTTVGSSGLSIEDGKNIEIKNENGSYTFNVVDNPEFTSVKAESVTVGGKVDISSNGIDMGGTKLTGLAGGSIAQNSTDAVTGGQLWDAYQRMDSMGSDIYRRMDDLSENINIVGAHAAALSGLHPIQYNPYEPTTLSAAVGTYRDEYAVAVGVFHYTRENVLFNLGALLCSDGDLMGRAGVSFALGKSSKKQPRLAGTMGGLQKQVLDMQAKLDELEAKNARSEDIIRQNMELIRELKAALEAKR